MREKRDNKNLWFLALFEGFSSLIFQRGIFILFLISLGISNMKIGILQAVLFFTIFLSEFPSGVIGDRLGRNKTLLISVLLNFISIILMILHINYTFIIFSFVLEGLAMAFISGTYSALFYDNLKFQNKEEKYLKYNSNVKTVSNFLMGLAIVVGAFLKDISWELVYGCTLVATLLAGVFMLLVYDNNKNYAQSNKEENLTKTTFMKEMFNFFKRKEAKKIWLLILAASTLEAVSAYYYIISQVLLDFQNLSIKQIALVYGILQILTAFMYKISEKVNSRYKINIILLNVSKLFIAILFLLIIDNPLISLCVLVAITALADIVYISQDNYIQKMIPSEFRSSLLSLFSFMNSVITGIIYVVYGRLGDLFPQRIVFMFLIAPCTIALSMFFMYFKSKRLTLQKV